MSGPLVIALRTRDAGPRLAGTLESLNAQGDVLRWWLRDAGSTDETVWIARRLARACDVVETGEDRGEADGINKALAQAGGNYLGFIQPGQAMAPGAAAAIVECFVQNPTTSLLWARPENGGPAPADLAGLLGAPFDRPDWQNPVMFFRSAIWQKSGPLDTRCKTAFEFAFATQALASGARARLMDLMGRPVVLGGTQRAPDRAEVREIVRRVLAANPQFTDRAGIVARVSFDSYDAAACAKPAFAKALFRNLSWLRAPAARRRLFLQ